MEDLFNSIISWYQNKWKQGINRYPWRFGKRSPYEVLIAEILLQHTTAKAIFDINAYQIFLKKFPNIEKLRNASLDKIAEIIKPLGLYNQKAERIKKLTKYIIKKFKGKIPNNKKDLLDIPGIGDYISNAILTFAYNQNEVPLDNNLKRIGLLACGLKGKKELVNFYKKLAKNNPKILYWALFDIGRFHCRKPMPKCEGCPLSSYCITYNKYHL